MVGFHKIIITKEKMKKAWFFFRSGYSTYLAFAFGFSNFLLLLYGLTPLKSYIGFLEFGIVSAIILIPTAVIIGLFHNRQQSPIEQKISALVNPYKDKILPDSKETFSNDYSVYSLNNTLWNINTNIWAFENAKWNLGMTRKNMMVMNKLSKTNDYTDDDFKKIDEWIKQHDMKIAELHQWLNGFTGWRAAFIDLGKGISVQDAAAKHLVDLKE